MQRIVTPEILDSEGALPAEVAAALADLRLINRWFGGLRVMRKLVQRVAHDAGQRELSLLDVAGASGDVVRHVRKALARERVALRAVVLDRVRGHLAGDIAGVQGDALKLPFRDASFDVVSSSLLVHDLQPDEVRRFVDEALRVCRRAVLINELRRSRVHLALVYAGLPLFRSRITRHDAVASVRQAYTADELRAMLPPRAQIVPFYLCRMGAIIWK